MIAWGQYAQAEALSRKALSELERTNGPDDSTTLSAVNNLAATLTVRGDYAEAEVLLRRVLTGRERDRRPSEHSPITEIEIVMATGNLANMPRLKRSLAAPLPPPSSARTSGCSLPRSRRLYPGSLPQRWRWRGSMPRPSGCIGGSWPRVATTLTRLSVVLHESGENAEALRYSEQALAIEETRLPPGHPALADTLELQASVLRALQQPERAAAGEAKARAIREQQQFK